MSWLWFAQKAGGTILWACTVPGCQGGNLINDPQRAGRSRGSVRPLAHRGTAAEPDNSRG
jgi:hypothetical protein